MNTLNLKPQEATRSSGSSGAATQTALTPSDDVHLAELVRSLRALAAESPERQEHLESIARAYALGTYQSDSQATAGGIISEALNKS